MGFGAIRPRPFVVEGEVQARPTLPWSLSCDHRLIDGDVATAFAEPKRAHHNTVDGIASHPRIRRAGAFDEVFDLAKVRFLFAGRAFELHLSDAQGSIVVQITLRVYI